MFVISLGSFFFGFWILETKPVSEADQIFVLVILNLSCKALVNNNNTYNEFRCI